MIPRKADEPVAIWIMHTSHAAYMSRFGREITDFIKETYHCDIQESGICPMQIDDWFNQKWRDMTRQN